MRFLKCRLFVVLTLAVLVPAGAVAQDRPGSAMERSGPLPGSGTLPARTSGIGHIRIPAVLPELQPAARHLEHRSTDIWRTTTTPNTHRMGWAIGIGIGAGVGAAAVAASRYGENEGGTFCGRCFAEWSAVAIPAGAGVGAAIGYFIDRARR